MALTCPDYRVKVVLCRSGERLPILVNDLGMPVFDAITFALLEMRSRNRAVNTIKNALYAIRLLFIFLAIRKINLVERLVSGRILSLREVEALAALLRQYSRRDFVYRDDRAQSSHPRISSGKERFRKDPPIEDIRFVGADQYCYRLIVVREYLNWKVSDFLSRSESSATGGELTLELERLLKAIDSRIPTVQSQPGLKEGLSKAERDLLLSAVHPESDQNPWKDAFCRIRNYAIVAFLFDGGQRRGESLGIRIPHISMRDGSVTIARQPDSALDPRKDQPNAKTRAHVIFMSEELQPIELEYLKARREIPTARHHDFLFVARNGEPLSLSSVNKIFNVLRRKFPALPLNLSPHSARYTWNDNFSDECDAKGVSDADEQDWRNEQMGWTPGSRMSVRYSRRRLKRKVQEASLAHQSKLFASKERSERE